MRTIEIEEDRNFRRRAAWVQKIGWLLVTAFLIASVAGAFGEPRLEKPFVSSILVYFFLLFIIRISGRRTLGEMSTFDLVLLLIISETCQQALVGDDKSVLGAWTGIATLVGADVTLSLVKTKSKFLERWMEGAPSILIEDGKLKRRELERARLEEDDIREAARMQLGLARLSQIRHAVLEKDGSISVIPWDRHSNFKLNPAT